MDTSIRSDALADLRPFFSEGGLMAALGNIFELNLIIDANIVLEDLRWMLHKRVNPEARTGLLEVLAAGTLRAFAPTYLLIEMDKKLRTFCEQEGIPYDQAEEIWTQYRGSIQFIEAGGPVAGHQDPKDVPYIKLQEQLNALILTKDTDLSQMGARTTTVKIVAQLRDYSRSAAVEYTFKMQGGMAFVVGAALIKSATQLGKTISPSLKRVPPFVWLIAAALIVAVLMHPASRQYVKALLITLGRKSASAASALLEHVAPLFEKHEEARQATLAALAAINQGITEPSADEADEPA